MPNIGPMELILVLIVVLIIFGPGRLPELGGAVGRGLREFRESVKGETPVQSEKREEKPND